MARAIKTDLTQDQATILIDAGKAVRGLEENLKFCFQERDWIIRQTALALLLGRHVLIYGIHGAAKSSFAERVFGSIKGKGTSGEDPQIFSIQLDVDTTKSDLVGPISIADLRNSGLNVRNLAGHLAEAHFAYLDEVLDAISLLRGINDILHERRLIEGRQNIRVPLLTAIGATNRSPSEVEAMYPGLNLGAVNDRWDFVGNVGYVNGIASVTSMVMNGLFGKLPFVEVPFHLIQQSAQILANTNMFPDDQYVQAYVELITKVRERFKKDMKRSISDRRINRLTQVVEANAILYGRTDLTAEDLHAIGYALCPSGDSDEYSVFKEVADGVVGEFGAAINDKTDAAIKNALRRISTDIMGIKRSLSDPKWKADVTNVGPALKQVSELKDELLKLAPKLESTEREIKKLVDVLADLKDKINDI